MIAKGAEGTSLELAKGAGGISFEHVSVRYGDRGAVHDVSLAAGPGEVVALAGPNGSGKSSLLRVATGLLVPSEGLVRLPDGSAVGDLSSRARALRLAWMPQEEPAGDNVSLADYVAYGRYAHFSPWAGPSASDVTAVARALAEVDLAREGERGVRELSGGERQRARLARALAQETPVLLLDEPTAHLDIGHQLDVLARVRRIARASLRTVVVALHDLNLAARFSDRIAVLSHGRLVAVGTPTEVLSPELLERVWGIVAEVRRDGATGVPYLLPRLPPGTTAPGPEGAPGPRVHVVAGGGSGASLLRRLVEAGYDVTAGVLPLFDTDSVVAKELGVPTAVELPFVPIGRDARAELGRLVEEARAIVVAPFPVGPANLANLETLVDAVGRRPVALFAQPNGVRWDYTDGSAEVARRRLVDGGASIVEGVDEAISWLAAHLPRRGAGPSPGPEEDELDLERA
jgi:iron complex transport system ATP-binding protein